MIFFILTLPTYLIRFKFGNLPSTLLEVEFTALLIVWALKYFKSDWPRILEIIKKQRGLFIFVGLFFLASVINIFISGIDDSNYWHMTVEALGVWRAFFLQPMILFFILLGRSRAPASDINARDLMIALSFSTVSISVVALIQKFTGQLYAPQLWDDVLGGRVTAFFTTPNAIGLFVAPIIFLMIIILAKKDWSLSAQMFYSVAASLVLAIFAIWFSYSQGAWVALAAGVVVFAYLIGWRKIAVVAVLFALAFGLYSPGLRTAILFQDQAGKNRLTIWSYTETYLTASPLNFAFGTGIRKFFDKVQKPYYDHKKIEPLLYPHNILLNFWTETGLLGMISFTGILVYLFIMTARIWRAEKLLGAGLVAALMVFCMHGLVDVPYFKNDLAFGFWMIAFVILSTSEGSLMKFSKDSSFHSE